MQVILLERVAKLGQMGEVVDVKPGYARNFLLPQGKALSASKANIEAFEGQKAQLEAQNLETKKEAEALADKLNGQQFIVIRSASDSGALYGSVTTRDAADVATAEGFTIDRKQVVLGSPIKDLGLHDVTVILHPEVEATIQLNVARSPQEAQLQAAAAGSGTDHRRALEDLVRVSLLEPVPPVLLPDLLRREALELGQNQALGKLDVRATHLARLAAAEAKVDRVREGRDLPEPSVRARLDHPAG